MADKKGKLFGKINIIDLLVIIVIVIALIFLGIKFLGNNGGAGGGGSSGKTHVEYTVLVESVQPEVYQNVKELVEEGDATLMASGELLDGRVTAVTSAPHEDHISINSTTGEVAFPLGGGLLDLTFTIECNVANPITTEIGTQEVRIGKNHIVKTDKFELSSGIILDCTWGEDAD